MYFAHAGFECIFNKDVKNITSGCNSIFCHYMGSKGEVPLIGKNRYIGVCPIINDDVMSYNVTVEAV